MMLRTDDLQLFVLTADLGSISAAARQLELSPALASVALKRLEQQLKTQLILRSTRSLRLTTAGTTYLDYARQAIQLLGQGQQLLQLGKEQLSGELTLSIPSDIGRNCIVLWLAEFQQQHPRLQLKIRVSDRLADLGRLPVDLALRYGEPKDSQLIAMPLVPDNHRVLCASPDYIHRCGAPERPQDISEHQVLQLVLGEAVHNKWQFWLDGQLQQVQVRGALVADDGDVVRRWAVAGLGLAYKSRLDILSDLRSGALVRLLPDYQTEQAPLYLLAVQRLSSSAVFQALSEFLLHKLRLYWPG
jgi:DNA-binding transcriptional LysR family regulator